MPPAASEMVRESLSLVQDFAYRPPLWLSCGRHRKRHLMSGTSLAEPAPGHASARYLPASRLPALTLRLLGGFELRHESGEAVRFARPRKKAQALLAYLACHRGQAHLRDKLAALLWPDMEPDEARANLRQALSALRGAAPAALRIDADTATLTPDAMQVDALVFEQGVRAATLPSLLEASDLYRGDFLAGLDVGETPFEEWLVVERERLRELAIQALAQATGLLRQAGDREAAVATARRLLVLDPLQEPMHRTVMRLYAELGRRDAALRQYQVCIDVLRRELDIEPEEDTRRLYQGILSSRSMAAAGFEARQAEARDHARRASVVSRELTTDEPKMVGRKTELEHLNRALDQACGGVGQVVMVLGEGGIGKTRLVRELAVHAADRDALVMTGHAYPGAQGLPYASWVEAMRSERLTEDPEIRGGLGPIWASELARLLPELGHAAEGPVAHLRLFEAVAKFLACVAASRPVMVVLEDVHWADELSLRLLAMASRRLRAMPVLVVATARDDELEDREPLRDLLRNETVTRLNLAPLSRLETTALVRTLAARRPEAAVAELAARIWEGCGGNPLVAVETLRGLDRTTALDARAVLPVPERVRELVTTRLERLSEASRRLVAVAAVIGRAFTFDLLQSAAGVSVERAVEGLEELVRRRLLRTAGERFDFVHDRIREVVAEELLGPRRRMLHRQVAEAIESLHADELAPHAAALGLHYLEGEVWPRAIAYLRQAANRAFAHAAYRDALPYFERALAALERLPAAERRIEDTVDLRIDFGGCLAILAELHQSDGIQREALAAAEAAGDRERLRRVLGFCGNHHWWMAEYHRAEQVLEHARSLAAPEYDLSEMELWYRAVNRHARGEYRVALDFLDQAARKAEQPARSAVPGVPGPRRPASPTFFRVCCLVELGQFDEALGWAQHDFQLAKAMPHAYRLSLAAAARGLVHLRRGEAAAAIGPLEYGLTLAVESSYRASFPRIASLLVAAYAAASREREALSLLEPSVTLAVPCVRGSCSAALGEAYLHLGRVEEAEALADELLAWSAQRAERGSHAWGLWLSAEICARRSIEAGADQQTREAEARYLLALASAGELEMRPLVARCHLGLGSLPGGTGERAQRGEHLETARLMFGEMGMRSWRERADADLGAVASA